MRMPNWMITGAVCAALPLLWLNNSNADYKNAGLMPLPVADTARDTVAIKDTVKYEKFKNLPLQPARKISFNTKEGSWMSMDISPDGKTILFDLMGDIYTMPSTGGKATVVTKGLAFDAHPRYSPDGKKILFTSDRSGGDNLWYIDTEKKDTVQLTFDNNQNYPSGGVWTPDGNYIIYCKGRLNMQMFMIHYRGGDGDQLFGSGGYGLKTIDPALSADGNTVYFSARYGPWNYNATLPQYELGTYDRKNGKMNFITSRYGSAFTPVLSKDGKWMVYGSRYEDKTGLVLRNLSNGDEKWLAYPVQRDDQESIATMGVLPGMAFTPDSKSVIAYYGGIFHHIPIDGTAISDIPIDVDMQLELGPLVNFKYPVSDTAYQLATQIRDAVPSPDGKKLAFTVLNRLYVMDYPGGTPKRLTSNDFTEAQPAWSPDGNSIVYTTWQPSGGHLFKINLTAKTNAVTQLTKEAGLYQNPVYNITGDRVVFIKSQAQRYKDAYGPSYDGSEDDLCWISNNGGDITTIDKTRGRYNPHFCKKDADRIYMNTYGNLISMKWDGTDQKMIASITGITTFGMMNYKNGRPDPKSFHCIMNDESAEAQEMNMPSAAGQINISPEGGRALAQINNEIYVMTLPVTGKTLDLNMADASNASFPARELTELGGEFPFWQNDGKTVHWSLGNAHFTFDVDRAQFFEDSLKEAKKAEDKRIEDSTNRVNADSVLKKAADSLKKIKDSVQAKDTTIKKEEKKEDPSYKAAENQVKVYFKKDIPQGAMLLKNARIITMKGEEVFERGDILIENNRIKAVGNSGSVSAPSGAKIMDVSGKTIIPGFVDPHSHMWPNWGVHKNQIWVYAANLAYGVTTTRDPQTATTDVLTYSDMADAGMMMAPRVYSTGPGVGFWSYNVKDSAQADHILKQYSKYYNTKYIKMYLTGNRKQREWIIQAARNQQLMPTTEGGLNIKLNLTNLLDGYPGHEHALPIYPLYNDVFKTIAQAKMIVTPTLLVSYGGPFGENYYWETENPYHDPKVQHFFAYEELAAKTRRVGAGWFMYEEQIFPKHSKNMQKLIEQGGMVGVGSHGEFQGLGYHWEVWALQSGGMRNIDALKAATILGAQGLGLDVDLGSLEPGKLADLIILDKNPLDNIRNTNTIKYVMKNGRLYDGNTCDEVYPQQRKLDRSEWNFERPSVNTNEKE